MHRSFLTHLRCTKSGKEYDPGQLNNLSDDGAPLWACYDLEQLEQEVTREEIASRRNSGIWKYREMMPVRDPAHIVTLGEGGTPLVRNSRLGSRFGMPGLMVKDESQNPTGSFKARGISAAVSAAVERGAKKLVMPSAGNAAGAMAAYAAKAGLEALVFMPEDTPLAFRLECDFYGAEVRLVEGLISDCGRLAEEAASEGYFSISTLKEPYRLEGKKTMGLELAEQLDWTLPDVIVYPTGGGTGLIGMWKAFKEMQELGWIEGDLPRMVSVQSDGCAPIVRAFENGTSHADFWEGARTISSGLRVPSAVGDFLILDILRESGGTAVAVSDQETLEFSRELAAHTGIFPAPEGGATLAALNRMKENGLVREDEQVVLFNTGTGYKYLEALNNRSEELMEKVT